MDNSELGLSAAAVIGVLSGIAGLISFLRTSFDDKVEAKHSRDRITDILLDIRVVITDLQDVLKHPDDSGFGVGDVHDELRQMHSELTKLIEERDDRKDKR